MQVKSVPQPHTGICWSGTGLALVWYWSGTGGDGAVLIWVPVIIETGESRRVNVSFDAALLEAVDHEAGRRGMTRSGLLADAVRKEIVTT